MKKRTSSMSRRIVSLLMSMVLTLTLVTPAAFATEVVGGSGTAIIEGNANPADVNTSGDTEGDNSENKNTEDGKGEQQPANPGDENKNPGEGDGGSDDANKPGEDNKGKQNTEDENNSEDDIAPLNDDTDSDVWDGKPAEKFAGGAGTVDDPYKISTGAELAYLAEKVNGGESYSGEYFKLTNDIRLNEQDVPTGGNSWTPIGNGFDESFSGIFDGAGHVIRGLYISDAAFPGLFGMVDGTVQNLVVQGSVTGGDEAIGESEAAGGICSTSEGEIQNCGFYGKVSDSTDMLFIGGVAGIGNATNCWYYSLNDEDSMCDHPDAERLMLELAAQLETVKGKKSYGYLPKRLKKLVDEIVDEMERLPGVSRCYDQWLRLQGKVAAYYHDKPQERIPLSQQKEFRQIKNAVIQEAERLHLGEIGFEEKGLNQQDEPEEYRNASYDYWTLRDVIRDESLTMEERGEAVSEMERLAESGDMYAQYLMGKLWRDGPLLIPDSVEARYWFKRAAEQGHLVAQYSLAKLYLSDDVEVRDIRLGMNWLYTAAVNGSHYAMYRLAKELFKGDLIKRNSDAAVEWFTRSAERGNPYAQYMLGKLYLAGKEVPRDEEKAAYWLTQSAEQGNQYAQYLLNHLEENRPPSAMLAVTRLLHHMSRIFRDNSVPKSRPGGIQIDRKRLKKLQEKRMALGHKPDDHEEQWPDMTM